MKNFFLALMVGACLVGDNYGCITDTRGILMSAPNHAQIHEQVIPQKTRVIGDVTLEASLEYNGQMQSKEDMEKAGFYSIVTSEAI